MNAIDRFLDSDASDALVVAAGPLVGILLVQPNREGIATVAVIAGVGSLLWVVGALLTRRQWH